MGVSTYNSGGVHGVVTDEPGLDIKLSNSKEVQLALELKGHEMIELAMSFYEAQSQHESEAPIYYISSFSVKKARHGLVKYVQVWNEDPTAALVEFGGKAGEDHQTPVLRYHPFGKAADVLETEAQV